MFKVLKENTRLYATWLIMIILISICVATTKLFSVAALLVFSLFVMLSPINDSCVLLFGLMPFANIFKYNAGSTSFFTICELLVVLLAVLKYRKTKSNFMVSMMIFLAYMIATSFDNFSVLIIIKVLLGFYLIYLSGCYAKKSDVINISYLISASTIITMLLSTNKQYFTYIEPYLLDLNYVVDSSGQTSNIMRLSGFLCDPNYCSVLVIMSLSLLCVLYYYGKIRSEFWIFSAFLIPLGFLTYSKSYFICISALVIFIILFILFPKHKGLAFLSILGIAAVITMALSGRIEVLNVILGRFSSGDITTGRTALNEFYLTYIWNNPDVMFFGEGIAADRIVNAGNNVHNIYIEGLFKLGLVGCIIYIFTLLKSFPVRKKGAEKRGIVNFFPLSFLAILYCALAGISMYELPFYLSIAFLAKDFNLLDENVSIQEKLERNKSDEKI